MTKAHEPITPGEILLTEFLRTSRSSGTATPTT